MLSEDYRKQDLYAKQRTRHNTNAKCLSEHYITHHVLVRADEEEKLLLAASLVEGVDNALLKH